MVAVGPMSITWMCVVALFVLAQNLPLRAVVDLAVALHPLRLQLLDLLRFDGPSTATERGRRMGESSGSTSYHLRQLARYGFIEDASARGGRERVWRYRQRRVMLEAGGGGRELLAELLRGEACEFDRFLAQCHLPPEWDAGSFLATRALRLTSAELAELRDGMSELLGRFRRAEAAPPPADTRPVRVLAFGYPLPLEET
jgi:DNA-binding MarR family transcriptional regulator